MKIENFTWLEDVVEKLQVKHHVHFHEVVEILESRPVFRFLEKGNRMARTSESSISQATSYQEMGEYWDSHDAGEVWEQTRPAEFEVEIKSEKVYFPLGRSLAKKVWDMAREQGISAETLLNLWVQEKILHAGQGA